MTVKELKNKWNGRNIYNNPLMEEELVRSYSEDLENTFKTLLKANGGELIRFDFNLDYVSGYAMRGGKFVYFNYRMPNENGKINLDDNSWMNGILVRSLSSINDTVGGDANYCNFDGFNKTLSRVAL